MENSLRPQRNRRHSRRVWPPDDDMHQTQPAKRLFTPEIKRMLKDWLVRRRENPYPSRDEKKRLAFETGLTYTQICNWFANWRRKLKNSEHEKAQKSWGHLIKNYNTNAKGNIEQFSISSADSIWEKEDGEANLNIQIQHSDDDDDLESRDEYSSGSYMGPSLGSDGSDGNYSCKESSIYKPNFYVESRMNENLKYEYVTDEHLLNQQIATHLLSSKPKYKQQIMEKYLKDTATSTVGNLATPQSLPGSGAELNKWLVSAVKFAPNKNNYHIEWNNRRQKLSTPATATESKKLFTNTIGTVMRAEEPRGIPFQSSSPKCDLNALHHKDELDAAEALANMAFNCRQRLTTALMHTTQPQRTISS